jgi:hypothetical protein
LENILFTKTPSMQLHRLPILDRRFYRNKQAVPRTRSATHQKTTENARGRAAH